MSAWNIVQLQMHRRIWGSTSRVCMYIPAHYYPSLFVPPFMMQQLAKYEFRVKKCLGMIHSKCYLRLYSCHSRVGIYLPSNCNMQLLIMVKPLRVRHDAARDNLTALMLSIILNPLLRVWGAIVTSTRAGIWSIWTLNRPLKPSCSRLPLNNNNEWIEANINCFFHNLWLYYKPKSRVAI
jgi:hypothetical protein